MVTPRENKTETVSASSTNSGIYPTLKALFDAMQKQNESLTQQMSMLTLRMDEVLTKTQTGNVSEASSLITVDEVTVIKGYKTLKINRSFENLAHYFKHHLNHPGKGLFLNNIRNQS